MYKACVDTTCVYVTREARQGHVREYRTAHPQHCCINTSYGGVRSLAPFSQTHTHNGTTTTLLRPPFQTHKLHPKQSRVPTYLLRALWLRIDRSVCAEKLTFIVILPGCCGTRWSGMLLPSSSCCASRACWGSENCTSACSSSSTCMDMTQEQDMEIEWTQGTSPHKHKSCMGCTHAATATIEATPLLSQHTEMHKRDRTCSPPDFSKSVIFDTSPMAEHSMWMVSSVGPSAT